MTSSGATPDGLDTENVRARLEAIDNHEQMALFALEIIPTALFEIESLRSQFEAASREIHVYQKMLADYEKERERYEAFNAQLEAANKVVEAARRFYDAEDGSYEQMEAQDALGVALEKHSTPMRTDP